MKLKKNELIELAKLGEKAISGKIAEAQKELAAFKLNKARGKVKNLREGKITRRAIAVLKTLQKGAL